jgi:hypothetical protein
VRKPTAPDTGRDPTAKELTEAKRVASLHIEVQRRHPSALRADPARLGHIHTYGALPEFYLDRPFRCRECGKEEIWKAADQKLVSGGGERPHGCRCGPLPRVPPSAEGKAGARREACLSLGPASGRRNLRKSTGAVRQVGALHSLIHVEPTQPVHELGADAF